MVTDYSENTSIFNDISLNKIQAMDRKDDHW